MIQIKESEWKRHVRAHRTRLSSIVHAHLDRASRAERHPVMDFLFQYYPFAPSALLNWSPGYGVTLDGEVPPGLVKLKEALQGADGWRLDRQKFPQRRRDALGWVISLLEATSERAPRFGCFGLHEWAMVYQTPEIRHDHIPLRLSHEETDRVVASMPIACSHYDAFRFFTEPARPLNRLQPALENRLEHEQRGCLHVNMDLYKWASQWYPWICSDVLADAFLLAVQIREVDMRASPYDLASFGYKPIPIETEDGRNEYAAYQRQFADAAQPIRFRLIEGLRGLQRYVSEADQVVSVEPPIT